MITLANISTASDQQIFDQIANHLLTQNRKSQNKALVSKNNSNNGCRYRHNGLKCAAGCLIGDNEYIAAAMEGKGWIELVREKIVPFTHGQYLIVQLQAIHDDYLPRMWSTQLNNVAGQHGLSNKVVEDFLEKAKNS
jgi:hypothetical protein